MTQQSLLTAEVVVDFATARDFVDAVIEATQDADALFLDTARTDNLVLLGSAHIVDTENAIRLANGALVRCRDYSDADLAELCVEVNALVVTFTQQVRPVRLFTSVRRAA